MRRLLLFARDLVALGVVIPIWYRVGLGGTLQRKPSVEAGQSTRGLRPRVSHCPAVGCVAVQLLAPVWGSPSAS